MNDLISIIMPAYNAEKTIRESIESVLSQTLKNWELIVINDASIDKTELIVGEYCHRDSRIILVNNDYNIGVSKTRKKGVEKAQGLWIAFLDSDDLWAEDKLEKQIKYQLETGGHLIFTGSAFVNDKGDNLNWKLKVPKTVSFRQLLKQNIISNSSVLIHKKDYMESMIVKDNCHEDFACWLNYLKRGNVAYGLNEPLITYRLSSNSKSGNKIKAAKMNWNAYKSIGLSNIEAFYYMIWYTFNGLVKYKKLKMRR